MADSVFGPASSAAISVPAVHPRHSALIRLTHWLTVVAFFALLVSGVEVLLSHPRFYWGESGSVNDSPLFILPVPASRASVPTSYNYKLPDQNGWSRSLHFQSAWLFVATGLLYFSYGIFAAHFRRKLFPAREDLSWRALSVTLRQHLRRPSADHHSLWSYNLLQQLTYLSVVFVLVPLVIWTGLAMSPAVMSVFPLVVSALGGQQSARTIHFFVSILLLAFVLVHVVMIGLTGFRSRMRAMTLGNPASTDAVENTHA
jgi:thiosulfate reductase cytochrome b subunit